MRMSNETSDNQLWNAICNAQQELDRARYLFFHKAIDKFCVFRRALLTADEAVIGLEYLRWTADHNLKKKLLPELLQLASSTHNNTVLAREIILAIDDCQWVVDTIDSLAMELLVDGDDEEYLRVGELYADLDEELLTKHLDRCRSHPDPLVRDVVTYFEDEDD